MSIEELVGKKLFEKLGVEATDLEKGEVRRFNTLLIRYGEWKIIGKNCLGYYGYLAR